MKVLNTKLKKTLFFVGISIIIVAVATILLISPIAKYFLERYDEKYTGRQIKTGLVYVNPFTGYILIRNLKIYESKNLTSIGKKDSVFLSAKWLSVNFAILKLFSKTIEITEIKLNRPKGIIIQNKKEFNFSDLVKKYTPKKTYKTPSKIHFNILSIKIKDGEFHYYEKSIPVNYYIKEANFESVGKNWTSDTIAIKYSFLSGAESGSAKGNLTINFKTLDYRIAAAVFKFDLKFIEQYLKDLINYGSFKAKLDANINAIGNFGDKENINAKGMLAIHDFQFGKTTDDDYVSFDTLVLCIEELNPKKHLYLFESLSLSNPYLKYERYDYLDNLQMMFGKKGANIAAAKADPARFNLIIEIADYIKILAKNFFQSDYKINKLAIYNGILKFNDYSLTEKFSIEANPLYVIADSINKNRKRVEISLKSGIQPFGNISVLLSINPIDSGDFDMKYHIQKLPASIFNPYLITFTSYPLDRGTIELNGTWNVRNSIIKSNNHILIIDPRITTRLINNDTKWIPSPIIMFLIRESGNVIDYKVPITGDLKNPKFHISDVITDIIGNIFVNPATTQYRAEVRNLENEIEKSLELKWDIRQNSLMPDQEVFINKMVDFLIHNPEASIEVYPVLYAEKEKEHIRFFEARKKYFLLSKNKNALVLSDDDSLEVDKMSVKYPMFVQYLNKQVYDTLLFTIEEKCNNFVGSSIINTKFRQLNKDREDAFMLSFNNKALKKRVIIKDVENTVPYNGFSFYKIVYKGEFPKALIKAYMQMNELNHLAPRKRFKKERDNLKI